jgi:hypothetical protein
MVVFVREGEFVCDWIVREFLGIEAAFRGMRKVSFVVIIVINFV